MFALSRSRREEKAFREIIIRSDLWIVTSSVVDARGRRGRGELAKAEGKRAGDGERRDAFRGETHGSRAVG